MNDEDNEQLRQQVELEEPWHQSQRKKDQARQFTDEWRRECKEWFDAFDKRMQEIFNDR